ncbi:MlaD family protein [Nocardia vaccinii]|uniref:MlaD family protein n=1 Tax=Nocardia vaccinii TaxID=1822 RepID=UPI001FE16CF3|nr:MlaD family protein [Nocardia vaccinii]
MPLPAPSVGSHFYTLTASFANALNLPAKAKVQESGDVVGEVASMTARDYTAVVAMHIESTVSLPVGTTAELRSATPLGDVFVALSPPASPLPGGGVLHDGDSIPLASTSASATIEDVLSRAALLVDGGAIRDLTQVLNGLGKQLAGKGDNLATLIANTTTLVEKLSARSQQIHDVDEKAGALTATLAAQQSTLTDIIAAAGPALTVVSSDTRNITDLIAEVNEIARQLEKFPSVNGTSRRSLLADVDHLAAGMSAASANPNANLDSLNDTLSILTKLSASTGGDVDVDVRQIAAGAIPDLNFPGNPAAKVPDPTDWVNFVGSLEYSLNRLHDRVIGPRR